LKSASKSILSKEGNKTYHKFELTIRDSPIDFINVSCWGSIEFIDRLISKVKFMEIIRLNHPIIKLKDESNSMYRPWTSSPFELTITDKHGNIQTDIRIDEAKVLEFEKIKNMPIREHNDYYTLEDVTIGGDNLINKDINLLFGIKEV
jgi:meiosis-specific with OB domain-containing protein